MVQHGLTVPAPDRRKSAAAEEDRYTAYAKRHANNWGSDLAASSSV